MERTSHYQLEVLEPRILLAGDAGAVLASSLLAQSPDDSCSSPDPSGPRLVEVIHDVPPGPSSGGVDYSADPQLSDMFDGVGELNPGGFLPGTRPDPCPSCDQRDGAGGGESPGGRCASG